MSDYEKLKWAAIDADQLGFVAPEAFEQDRAYGADEQAWLEFVALANPAKILSMIATISNLQAELECARGDSNTADIIIEKLKSEQADLIRAIEIVLLHVKPSKANAAALNHAYQAISKFNQDQAKERT